MLSRDPSFYRYCNVFILVVFFCNNHQKIIFIVYFLQMGLDWHRFYTICIFCCLHENFRRRGVTRSHPGGNRHMRAPTSDKTPRLTGPQSKVGLTNLVLVRPCVSFPIWARLGPLQNFCLGIIRM